MSGPSNYDDVILQLASAGLIVDHLITGRMVRCKVEHSREKKGWYAIHEIVTEDGTPLLVGSYGVWMGADNNAQKIELKKQKLSKEQLQAIKTRLTEDKKRAVAQRNKEMARAAAQAEKTWAACSADGESDYLARKKIGNHGLRYTPSGALVVPMLDSLGRIHGLQFILPSTHPRKKKTGRDKEFWPAGMAMKGHFYLIGTPVNVLLIAEGYATAASLHEATGLPVAVAFNANNLLPVAEAMRKRYKNVQILICADDDHLTEGNPGVQMASAAALAISGGWVAPTFTIDREGKKITDFNDLHVLEGLHLVRSQIEEKIGQLWEGTKPTARASAPRGAGNGNLKPLLSVPEAVERYSLIYGAGGTMYDHQESALIPKSDVLDICVDHAWREWKLHADRMVVRLSEVGFDPTETDHNIRCNLWGGWPTKPAPGSCETLLELLQYLCSGEETGGQQIYEWVLKWLAYPIQHPGAKMRSALIFHGPQGVGKNMFFEAYAQIFGKYGRIVGQAEIDDKFNDWASGKLFMIADEVVARQELFHIKNKIKALITGENIRINPKNVAAHDERNHVNIVFLSNEKQPLVLEKDDRRFAVIWVPEKLPDRFYDEVSDEIKAGGIAALHDYLLNLDLRGFNEHSKPPMTQSKEDLIQINLDSVERFVMDWQGGETEVPFMPCASMDLYAAYSRWCRVNGVKNPRESNQFLGHIGKLRGWVNKPAHVFDTNDCFPPTRPKRIVIPPEADLKAAHCEMQGESSKSVWLTQCMLRFRAHLTNHMGDQS